MILNKLPEVYQKDTLISQMAKLFQNKNIMFSSSCYCDGGKTYVIKKPSGVPIFEKNRVVYSLIRGMAETLITSDGKLKSEKDTFKNHFSKGHEDIKKIYHSFRENKKQNVFVMTKMNKEEVTPFINMDLYNLIGSEVLKKHEGTEITLKEVLSDLSDKKLTPILIECQLACMNQFLHKMKDDKSKIPVEIVYFACFEGKMSKQQIGDEFTFDESLFKKVWESEKFDVKDDKQNQGKLYFKVYEVKKD